MATAWQAPWSTLDGTILREHVPLRHDLRRLVEHARELEPAAPKAEGDGLGVARDRVLQDVLELNELVNDHLWREETFLFALLRFPVLRVDPGAVRAMRYDHAVLLARLRRLGLELQAGTTASCRRLARDVRRVEESLGDLITLEEHCVYAQTLTGNHAPRYVA